MIHNSPQLEMTQCLPIVKRMSTVICANKILSSTKKIIELTLYTAKDESNQMLKKEVKYKKKNYILYDTIDVKFRNRKTIP